MNIWKLKKGIIFNKNEVVAIYAEKKILITLGIKNRYALTI